MVAVSIFALIFSYLLYRINLVMSPFVKVELLDQTPDACSFVNISADSAGKFPVGGSEDCEIINDRYMITSNFPYKIYHLSRQSLQYPLQFPLMFYDFIANTVKPVDMAATGFDESKEFKPHGISLLKHGPGDGAGLLAVVNHAVSEGESRVELFSVHTNGNTADMVGLRYMHSVGSFGAGTLNDVVLVDENTLFVTEWYKHTLPQDGSTAPLVYKIMQNAIHVLGLPIYTLHKCVRDASSKASVSHGVSSEWGCVSALSAPSMNGISTTRKRDILAVAQISTKSVHFYRYQAGSELEHLTSLIMPVIVDNLSLDSSANEGPDVDVWYGAGILRGLDYLTHSSAITNDTAVHSIPSGEVRVTYNRKSNQASVELLRTARESGCWCNSMRIPYSDVHREGYHTIIGSFCSSGVYVCH